ncbi:uncharacterized protein VTP21DRAFT_6393 [Calcarisporiella thermophila]|uniref:uncharacterized protein n=1 Tax=Calcarisporiella thermophila TaxID=911321 RepID=UPI0037422DB8
MAKGRSKSGETAERRRNRNKKHDLSCEEWDFGARELTHQLKSLGLYCKEIEGDGNCLFRALSDQLYGCPSQKHLDLRNEICDYIASCSEEFAPFVDEVSLDEHICSMRNSGVFGGHMELVAFARLKRVNVRVYQPGYIYVIEGGCTKNADPEIHIAYHTWQHYSSIRNIDGPHEGPPQIKITVTDIPPLELVQEDTEPANSMEKMIMRSVDLPLSEVRTLMRKHRYDPDAVINEYYERVEASDEIESDSQAKSEEKNSTQENTMPEKSEEPILEMTEPQAKQPKPKRLSARERKEQAKRRQKENRKHKVKHTQLEEVQQLSNNIKQLYV